MLSTKNSIISQISSAVYLLSPFRGLLTERHGAVFQGIVETGGQTENAIKHRINAAKKASNATDETLASIFNNKVCIPLDFEILESSLPLYRYGLGSRLRYELTFADYSDVIKASNPNASYTISNISLEFDTVTNASLSSQIRTEYMKSSMLHDRILRAHIFQSIIPIQAFQWMSIACQKSQVFKYSLLIYGPPKISSQCNVRWYNGLW